MVSRALENLDPTSSPKVISSVWTLDKSLQGIWHFINISPLVYVPVGLRINTGISILTREFYVKY